MTEREMIVQEFAKHPRTVAKAYNRLPPAARLTVRVRLKKHVHACEKAGIAVDPRFLPEIIEDLSRGREV
jgi:hypothetical protein